MWWKRVFAYLGFYTVYAIVIIQKSNDLLGYYYSWNEKEECGNWIHTLRFKKHRKEYFNKIYRWSKEEAEGRAKELQVGENLDYFIVTITKLSYRFKSHSKIA